VSLNKDTSRIFLDIVKKLKVICENVKVKAQIIGLLDAEKELLKGLIFNEKILEHAVLSDSSFDKV
jgi:hypothetical protein